MSQCSYENTVVITGAGSGLGAALARHFNNKGWRVGVTDALPARASSSFESLKTQNGSFQRVLDVTSQEDWSSLQQEVQSRWGGLQVLINNAGVATAGSVEETPLDDWQWVMDINLMGVVRGCREFAGVFRQQGQGHFVNMASFAGLAGLPHISSYGVSKAAVIALSESLRAEMHPSGVGVTVVCPAFVKTGLTENMRVTRPGTREQVQKWMDSSGVTAEDIAAQIFAAVGSSRFLLLTHGNTRWAWRFKRWLPETWFKSVVKKLQQRR